MTKNPGRSSFRTRSTAAQCCSHLWIWRITMYYHFAVLCSTISQYYVSISSVFCQYFLCIIVIFQLVFFVAKSNPLHIQQHKSLSVCKCTYQHILQFPSSRSPKTVSFSCLFCRVSSGLLGTEWPSDSPHQLPQLRQQLPLAAQRFTKCKALAFPCCTVWKQFHCIGEQCWALLNTLSYNLCNKDSQGLEDEYVGGIGGG